MSLRTSRFLGCKDPLAALAHALFDGHSAPAGEAVRSTSISRRLVDLERHVIAVPTARAQRLLLDALARIAVDRELALIPPQSVLPHELESLLCEAPRDAIASRTAVELALWRELSDERSEGVSVREVRTIVDAGIEVSNFGLGFRDIAAAASRHEGEPDRYLVIERALRAVRDRLRTLGFRMPFGEALSDRRNAADVVHLVGITELSRRLRELLDSGPWAVQPWIIASAGSAQRFDRVGALAPGPWRGRPPIVPRDRIALATDPIHQAEAGLDAVARIAERCHGSLSADEVLLVAADPELAPWVVREFRASGIGVHDARGTELRHLAPLRLLGRVREFQSNASTASLRRMVGLSALESAVDLDLVRRLDDWRTRHLDRPLGESWLDESADIAELEPLLAQVASALDRLPARASLARFAVDIGEWLRQVFARAIETSPRSMLTASIQALSECLGEIAAVPETLLQPMDRTVALDWLCAWVGDQRVREAPQRDELELVGWLELLFDPAPATVILGMNEGCVPSGSRDALLTDSLRRTLGLPTSESRLVRDQYVLATALERGPVDVVLGRKDSAGDPLTPSRLLLTGDGEELAERVTSLFAEPPARVVERAGESACGRVLPPGGECALEKLRVTAFRDYIHCPYRFWLRHILRLESVEVAGSDFNAATSGTLVHEVLHAVGKEIAAGSAPDTERMTAILDAELDRELQRLAGADDRGLIRLQRRFLRARMLPFVEHQMGLSAEGWEIAALECDLKADLDMADQSPLRILGRVDRVDRLREAEGWRLRVIDYKTGADASKPDGGIARDGTFRDLQLPLYRFMVERIDEATRAAWFGDPRARIVSVETGYFGIAAELNKTGFRAASKLDDRYDEAIARAREIVRAIRRGDFAMNPDASAYPDEPLELICRTAVLDSDGDDEEGDDE
ncbi:MAG: PD-(D/E)XK nuclease family protein [Planctomycetota bacterium]